jgi:hypothetical protein
LKDLLFENLPSSRTSVPKIEPNKVSILNGEKSLLLQKLLKSKKSEDLKAANELIKSMVQEVCNLKFKILFFFFFYNVFVF